MNGSQEAPALIQYACERCKTRFVLPPSSRKLSLAGRFRAFSSGVRRSFRFHEGLGSAYDTSRRQLLAKMDDEAYQSFVQSFRFCHECRQFVCNECWSTSRRSCLTCVAKSMTGTARPRPPFAPTGPEIPRPAYGAVAPARRGRLRRDAIVVALALAIVLLVVEAGVLLTSSMLAGPAGTPPIIYVPASSSPSASVASTGSQGPTATATTTATATAAATPSGVASPSPTGSPSAAPSPTRTPMPMPTIRITPGPTVPPNPIINCNGHTTSFDVEKNAVITCTWTNEWQGTKTATWYWNAFTVGSPTRNVGTESTSVRLEVVRGGVSQRSQEISILVN
jgi:hypothetical protein